MEITLIGHMTLLLEIDGVHFLTDPWFGPCSLIERMLAPRLAEPSISVNSIPEIDAMLVSHNHIDHFDTKAVQLAKSSGCMVIGSKTAVARAGKNGIMKLKALRENDSFTFKGVSLHAVHAEHPLAPDAIGFVIKGSSTLYFSGDARLKQQTIDNLAPFTLDIALIQAACAYYPFIGKDGMDLNDASRFADLSTPGFTVPLHLGCAGKWIDLEKRVKITKDSLGLVGKALSEWEKSMLANCHKTKILVPGEPWSPEKE